MKLNTLLVYVGAQADLRLPELIFVMSYKAHLFSVCSEHLKDIELCR